MRTSTTSANTTKAPWVYATLTVIDGNRQLTPAQVAFDRLIFTTPPHLTSPLVQIILTNGDAEQQHEAVVLPHDPDATRIPIKLVTTS